MNTEHLRHWRSNAERLAATGNTLDARFALATWKRLLIDAAGEQPTENVEYQLDIEDQLTIAEAMEQQLKHGKA